MKGPKSSAWQNRLRSGLSEQREKLKEKGFKSVEDFMWRMKHAAYKDFEEDLPKIREDFKGFFKEQGSKLLPSRETLKK